MRLQLSLTEAFKLNMLYAKKALASIIETEPSQNFWLTNIRKRHPKSFLLVRMKSENIIVVTPRIYFSSMPWANIKVQLQSTSDLTTEIKVSYQMPVMLRISLIALTVFAAIFDIVNRSAKVVPIPFFLVFFTSIMIVVVISIGTYLYQRNKFFKKLKEALWFPPSNQSSQ